MKKVISKVLSSAAWRRLFALQSGRGGTAARQMLPFLSKTLVRPSARAGSSSLSRGQRLLAGVRKGRT